MLTTICLLLFTSFFSLFFVIFGLRFSDDFTSRIRLPAQDYPRAKTYLWNVLFILSSFIMDNFRLRERIYRRITTSHLKLLPEEFFSIKIALMGILFWLAFSIFAANPMLVVMGLAAGYLLPDFWLANKIRLRKQAIIRLLPETVDLLSLCIEAGLEFTTAVDWIIKKAPKVTPMIEELTMVLEEVKWGKSRSQALKDMSKRLNIASVTSFSQTLIQGERMGTPIVESFNILSEDIRLQRFHRGERKALQAPMKMLIPLIFFILPVIAIIIGGPILIQFSHGDLFKGF